MKQIGQIYFVEMLCLYWVCFNWTSKLKTRSNRSLVEWTAKTIAQFAVEPANGHFHSNRTVFIDGGLLLREALDFWVTNRTRIDLFAFQLKKIPQALVLAPVPDFDSSPEFVPSVKPRSCSSSPNQRINALGSNLHRWRRLLSDCTDSCASAQRFVYFFERPH